MITFDVVVGNPPYQKENENNARKAPIYHLFYNLAFYLSNKATLISLARFLFNAGQTPNDWNNAILNDEHIKVAKYFSDSKTVFPSVDIKGGVAILFKDSSKNYGKIGIFMANNLVGEIVKKVQNAKFSSFSTIVYPKSTFGLSDMLYIDYPKLKSRLTEGNTGIIDANIFKKMPEIFHDEYVNGDISIYGRLNNVRVHKYIDKKYIKDIPNLHFYKVFIPGVNGTGKMGEILSTPEIGTPNECHTQTFMSIGMFKTKNEAIACMQYIKTKFARLLLGTLKITQNNPRGTWANIPLQDFTAQSDIDWSKSVTKIDEEAKKQYGLDINEIDARLYKKYALTPDEISFIESMIKPMG